MTLKESLKNITRRVRSAIEQGSGRIKHDLEQKPAYAVLIVIAAIGIGAWLGVRAGVLWGMLLIFAVYDWENRVIGVFALISLAACPVLLSLQQNDTAEIMAEYAYFFLAMTVLLQIIELKRHPERFAEEEEEASDKIESLVQYQKPEPKKRFQLRATADSLRTAFSRIFATAYRLAPSTFLLLPLFLSLLILGPMLKPGYVLALDAVFVPRIPWPVLQPGAFANAVPFRILLHLLSLHSPGWAVEKVYLLALFVALPWIAYRYLVPDASRSAKIWVALLYTINPFVYTRLIAGQWTIICAYATLPLVLEGARRLRPWLGAALALTSLFSLHLGVMGVIISTAFILPQLIDKTTRRAQRKHLGWITGSFLILTSYWTIPYLWHPASSILSVFDIRHEIAFRTAADPHLGTMGNVLAGYGFWAEREAWSQTFIWPKSLVALVTPAGVILAGVMLYGIWQIVQQKHRQREGLTLLILGVGAFIVACGVGETPFAQLNQWLFDHIGFWRGFRDSQKWSAVLILAYAGIGSWAIDALRNKKWGIIPTSLATIAIPLYTWTLFGGAWNQLQPVWYPSEWEQTNEIISQAAPSKTLFLPWHAYLAFPFTNGRVIANPARDAFSAPMMLSRDIGLGDISDQSVADPAYDAINGVVTGSDHWSPSQGNDLLREAGIRYILRANDAMSSDDSFTYDFLNDPSLRKTEIGQWTLYDLKKENP